MFFFFSGHGVTTASGATLLPVDAAVTRLSETGILLPSLLSVFTDRGLHKVVIALDACREHLSTTKGLSIVGISGTTGTPATVESNPAVNASLALFATKAGWYSYEDAGGRNGVFTRFLLEGLSGKADQGADGIVTFAELAAWLPGVTTSYALDRGIRQQAVSVTGSGDRTALYVRVSRVQPGITSHTAAQTASLPSPGSAAPSTGSTAPTGSTGSPTALGGEIKPLVSPISGHLKTALVNSLKDIDASIAKSGLSDGDGDDRDDGDGDDRDDGDGDDGEIEDIDDFEAESIPTDSGVKMSDNSASPGKESGPKTSTPYQPFSIIQLSLFSPLQLFPERYMIAGL
ncbi:MAG TPA: caspase family protein [Treponemataceae bacterium]|nr:caspase family protein [Treponemataceae bacterium]